MPGRAVFSRPLVLVATVGGLVLAGCQPQRPAVPTAAAPVLPTRTKNGKPLTPEQLQEVEAYVQRAAAKRRARAAEAAAEQQKQAQLRIFQAQMRDWEWRRSRGDSRAPLPWTAAPAPAVAASARRNPFASTPDVDRTLAEPAAAPAQASAPALPVSGGLGLTRSAVQSFFAQPEAGGFAFSYSTPVRGMPRTHGDAGNDEVALELIGPSEALQHVAVMVAMPDDDEGMVRRSYQHMFNLLRVTTPDWAEGPNWINASVPRIRRDGNQIETFTGRVRASLVGGGPLPILVLSFER